MNMNIMIAIQCSESSVRDLCENTTCPSEGSNVGRDNCCVWHANIHTCHPSVMVCVHSYYNSRVYVYRGICSEISITIAITFTAFVCCNNYV